MTVPRPIASPVDLDGRAALRLERRLESPPERVWRSLTDPGELVRWFPSVITWTPRVGETFDVDGQPGEVLRMDPPRLLEWSTGHERYLWELEPDGAGCLLIFTHAFDPANGTAVQHAVGWELYLNRLGVHLAGGFLSEEAAHEALPEVQERYAQTLDARS